jgi:hypothetical protein
MANERKVGRQQQERTRDAAADERIRRIEEEMDRREEEGWSEPESSAQKLPDEPERAS